MEKISAVALLVGLAALIAVSILQDRKPRQVGRTTLVPWMFIGIAATAAELIVIFYTLSVFLNR